MLSSKQPSRRSFIALLTTGIFGILSLNQGKAALPDNLEIIDCHTHFYDPSRPQGVPWPQKNTPLYRTVLPEHLRALPKIRPVQGTLVIEASSWLEDNQWLLDMAEKDPFVVGVIGKLLPDSPEFGAQLKRFASNPLFRGIRVSATAISAELARNNTEPLELLANLGLTLDLIGENCAALAPKLAEQFPKLQIVINHIGSTTITPAGPSKEWQNGIEAAAKHQNVFIKISALMESAATNGQTAPATPEIYHPYVSSIWDAFGDERVIYGSNWPVSERAGDYATLQQLALHFAEARGVTAARNFFALNSKRAYRWPERTGRKPSLQTSKP